MKKIWILISCCFMISCGIKKISKEACAYTPIEFEIVGTNWDPNPYKFSTYINDSVMLSNQYQVAAWDYSYIGNIESMHKAWDSKAEAKPLLTQVEKDSFSLFVPVDAIDYILKKAKEHRVVIINEGHHMPQHRVFTTQLLQGLKDLGFNHLGLETYSQNEKSDSILRAAGYPTLTSGYYTKEPQFGNMLRVAHHKGYHVFGYESEGHSGSKEREINQAKNIQAYLEEYPNEKFIIHCGFDHNLEGTLIGWEKSMAGRITEFTGIDPLTINQVLYSEKSKREFENPYYQLTDLDKASVFVDANNNSFGKYRPGAWSDIAVFHPRSKKFNRPAWMIYDDRREVVMSFDDAPIDCPCLVLAYKKGEKLGSAIPYDIQEMKDRKATLILDRSEFNIIIWNQKDKALVKAFK